MTKRHSILIVDDDPSNIVILAEGLASDYDISVARHGMQAISIAQKCHPDLILLDVGLPDMDGYEICRHLKHNDSTRDIPVIFITARDHNEDELKGLQLGAVDYVRKPFCIELVKARVQNQLELSTKTQLLAELAMLDCLTCIPNRRHFEIEFEKSWRFAQRKQRPLSVAILDIDYFKQYNDMFGHVAGDHCLKKVAKSISNSLVRPMDFVARFGGEEFVVILLDADEASTVQVAEKIRRGIEKLAIPHHYPSEHSTLTISIGVSTTVPQQNEDHRALLIEADNNLYHAKKMGRNCVAQTVKAEYLKYC
jgi:diguanylate cyclase (GGDEF)-like protein